MRVNILGCAPGWDKAPFGENLGEIWGLNDVHVSHPVDVVIDVHNLKRVSKGKEKIRRSPEDVKKCIKNLKKTGTLCYSTKEIKGIPNIKKYPYDDIVKKYDSDYFGGGPDYAVALAVFKGFTEIHLYGMLLIVGEEYYHQKPSLEHWLGIAKGAGVKTVIHDFRSLSSILKTPTGLVYGFNLPQRWRQYLMDNPKEYLESYS